MVYIHSVIVASFVVVLVWVFTKIKKIYTKLNSRNSKVPDVEVLKKVIPPSASKGWHVSSVSNGVPIWKYDTSFTFAQNLFASCTLLRGGSKTILEELKDVEIFSSLFPDLPSLKSEENGRSTPNKDVVSMSNINSNVRLTSVMTCHHIMFTLERFWFNGPAVSWLYMCPRSVLLSEQYGYWICFLLQDLDDENGCLLHILASYPSSMRYSRISNIVSSCVILTQEHMDSLLCKQTLKCNTEKSSSSDSDCSTKISRKKSRTPVSNSSNKSASTVRKISSKIFSPRKEGYGLVEEPATIKRIATKSATVTPTALNKLSFKKQPISQPAVNEVYTDAFAVNKPVEVYADALEENKPVEGTEAITAKIEPVMKELFSDISEKLLPYQKVLRDGFNLFLSVYEADENTPGWNSLGRKDEVHILKQDADEICASSCHKGTSLVKVPLQYILNYVLDVEYKKEYDNLFEAGHDVELLETGTKITTLIYQNVWPTTGRDFCQIAAVRHIKDNLYGVMVTTVEHPDCPPQKNKVRGEVIIGGFMLKEISVDPPLVELTYITRANLKGSIPQRIVNRVNAEQPMMAGSIRKHCERRYEIQDPPEDRIREWLKEIQSLPSVFEEVKTVPQLIHTDNVQNSDNSGGTSNENINNEENVSLSSQDDDKSPIYNEQTEFTNSPATLIMDDILVNKVLDKRDTSTPVPGDVGDVYQLNNGFDLKENHYSHEGPLDLPSRVTEDDCLINDSESLGDLSQFTEDYRTQLSVSEQELELPRDSYGQIDFITLGNQTAALLEEDFLVATKVNLTTQFDISTADPNSWTYQGTNKDVIIMRKIHSDQKIHSFLGRGVINVLPVTVWEAIRNPTTRFVYDNMLKRSTVVKEINERHKIVHMRHETHACFVKQARDFTILIVERVEQQRYVLAATSVDIPECPPVKDCVRGKVISSGWVVEPILQNGRSCSLVTYITQINFGGRLPTRLINFIAKRQPLSLAFLRDYLESAEF